MVATYKLKKKSSLILLFILYLCLISNIIWAGELVHIIKDGEHWYEDIFEERASCVEDEHLFIELLERDWNVICGGDKNFRRNYASWYGEICIKCRVIAISCSGNDWYRYKIKTD